MFIILLYSNLDDLKTIFRGLCIVTRTTLHDNLKDGNYAIQFEHLCKETV